MAKNVQFEFGALDDLQDMLKRLDGNMDEATEQALIESQEIVARKAENAMKKHRRTGKTAESIVRDHDVRQLGGSKEIDAGFRIRAGGLPSIFLMYGTTLHGQPHIKPDKELYDAVYGKKTAEEIEKVQEEVFEKAIEEAMK